MQPIFSYNCRNCGARAHPNDVRHLHHNFKIPGLRMQITCHRCGHQAIAYEHQRELPDQLTHQGGN